MLFNQEEQLATVTGLAIAITIIAIFCLVLIVKEKKQNKLSPNQFWILSMAGPWSWILQLVILVLFKYHEVISYVTFWALIVTITAGFVGFAIIYRWLEDKHINGRAFAIIALMGQVLMPALYLAILCVALSVKIIIATHL